MTSNRRPAPSLRERRPDLFPRPAKVVERPDIPALPTLAAPKLNRWRCKCGWYLTTVEHVEGVTPFLMACKSCGGLAESAFYRDDGTFKNPTRMWRQPTPGEFKKLDEACKEHVRNGGLLDYPIIA